MINSNESHVHYYLVFTQAILTFFWHVHLLQLYCLSYSMLFVLHGYTRFTWFKRLSDRFVCSYNVWLWSNRFRSVMSSINVSICFVCCSFHSRVHSVWNVMLSITVAVIVFFLLYDRLVRWCRLVIGFVRSSGIILRFQIFHVFYQFNR